MVTTYERNPNYWGRDPFIPSNQLPYLDGTREYQAHGARLGWLIDPDRGRLAVYHADGRVEWLDRPPSVTGDPVLPGFVLGLAAIWAPAL